MSARTLRSNCHSAIVRMELCMNGHIMPIAQLGPDFLVLKTPVDHPPAEAEIGMWIDGREDRWRVRLPDGISAHERRTKIAPPNGAMVD